MLEQSEAPRWPSTTGGDHMPKKQAAYIPNPAFRTTAKFSKLTEAQIASATHNVCAAYLATPNTISDSWINPALSFSDPIEQEYHRLSLAYDTSGVENLHAFIRATPESDLSPIELDALGNPFGGCDNPHEVMATIDSWEATRPSSRKKKAPRA